MNLRRNKQKISRKTNTKRKKNEENVVPNIQ